MGVFIKKCLQPTHPESHPLNSPLKGKEEKENLTKATSCSTRKKMNKIKKADVPIFSVEDIVLLEVLGKGGFGIVYRAWNKRTSTFLALKYYKDPDVSQFDNIQHEDFLLTEVKKVADCEKFLKYEGVFKNSSSSNSFILAMESGELDLIKVLKARTHHKRNYSMEECLFIFQSIARDFLHLQKFGIANRDVKTENVILVEQKNVSKGQKSSSVYHYKIADYGIGYVLDENQTTLPATELYGFTERYAAPEVIQIGKILDKKAEEDEEEDKEKDNDIKIVYDPFKADVFSLGKLFLDVFKYKDEEEKNPNNPMIQELKNLIIDMIEDEPENRITFKDVLSRLEKFPLKAKQPENEEFFFSEYQKIKKTKQTKKELFDEYYGNFQGYISIGNYDQATKILEQMEYLLDNFSTEFVQNEKLQIIKERCILNLDYHQKYDEALKLALLLFSECEKTFDNEDEHIAEACQLLAKIYSNKKETATFGKIEEYFQRALKIYSKGKDLIKFSKITLDCAIFYQSLLEVFEKAEDYFNEALTILEKTNFEKEKAYIYLKMACFYQDCKQNFPKAEGLFLKALEIQQKFFGEDHPDTATTYYYLGCFYTEYINDNTKAEDYLLKSIQRRENIFGENNPITAESYHEIASFYMDQMENDELAEKYYMRTFEIRKNVLGEKHPLTADIYNDLAIFYEEKKKYKQAEEFYLKALQIRREFYGEIHSSVAESLDNLGVFYKNIRKHFDKAEKYYLEALKTREMLFAGVDHTMIARSFVHLGVFYKNCRKNFEMAESFYQKALEMRLRLFGEDNEETSEVYYKLGYFYHNAKKNDEKAESHYSKALSILEKIFSEPNSKKAEIYESFALFYDENQNKKEAEKLYLKLLQCCEKNNDDVNNLKNYRIIADFYQGYDDPKALELSSKISNIQEKFYSKFLQNCEKNDEDEIDNIENYRKLAESYRDYDDSKALEIYLKILNIQENNMGNDDVEEKDIADTFFEIGLIYENTGALQNQSLAKDYFGKALAIREKILGKEDPETIDCKNHLK